MGLDEFVKRVEQAAPTDEPLDRLAAAVLENDVLTHEADELLDHFVMEARESGCSWAQIGQTLGVTKQAAQQRHAPEKAGIRGWFRQMTSGTGNLARFTPRARRAVEQAGQEAKKLRHPYVGTEHILLGLLTEPESIAGKVLAKAEVDDELVRAKIVEIVGEGDEKVTGHIPFTPRSKKTLELTLQEAVKLGHNYIGTEHILLALMQTEGLGAQILYEQGMDLTKARDEIIQMLSGYVTQQAPDQGDQTPGAEPPG